MYTGKHCPHAYVQQNNVNRNKLKLRTVTFIVRCILKKALFTSLCSFLFSAFSASSDCSDSSAAVLYLITWLSRRATVACNVATSCSAFCAWICNLLIVYLPLLQIIYFLSFIIFSVKNATYSADHRNHNLTMAHSNVLMNLVSAFLSSLPLILILNG